MLSVIESKISKLQQEFSNNGASDFTFDHSENNSAFSVDWNVNEVVLFAGDNLTSLKKLVMIEPGIVDLCYIDPPYNTGSNFIYSDNRKSPEIGLLGSHQAWIIFMLPRLVLAHELLKETGVLAISIDDYEFPYLKVLLDRIFGEKNFIGNIVVCRSKNGKGSKKNLASSHEYLLVYGKSNKTTLRGESDEDTLYDKEDVYGKYRVDGLFRKKGEGSLKTDRPSMAFPLYANLDTGEVSVDYRDGWAKILPKDSKGVDRRWLWGEATTRERVWQLYSSKNGVIYVKNYAGKEIGQKRRKIRTIWDDPSFYTERATNELTKIFGQKIFDTPKPIEFVKKIVDSMSDDKAVVLDFFAGSATTAHAIYELNKQNGSHRKCILMESLDDISSNHLAYSMGYKQMVDITISRLQYLKNEDRNFNFTVF
ncbi:MULTISPECIES: site-specific DNA-methyltransferase [Acinetobacter]|uniref:site-specific DNA-methyltransferase (adenine-specific) n=1 Tax=Acinetobacter sedimenti TaxID=2919922 RepID=A0A9X2B6B3_9GAMM|nr:MULTISPECIES: site-specific DNA-methyltransferase [Acinetobacter]MCJ8145942.1 site-specific DNA-methyltransferase [Acinetobacter sedimenti]MEB6681007.1 site-specific DNA-methyltransferase [Acinetobacter lwoffii]